MRKLIIFIIILNFHKNKIIHNNKGDITTSIKVFLKG